MMTLAAGLGPLQEIYSIDESYVGDLEGMRDLTQRAWAIRSRIYRWTSIPTCVGLAPTKTLAKLCNHVAKDAERKPGSYPKEFAHVCNWAEMSVAARKDILQRTAAAEVWGIGRRIAAQLAEQGILTAWDVANMPTSKARREWSVVLERTVLELQGMSCITLEQAPPPKKQIASTRSFGQAITTLPPLIEAVSEFATRAAEKLRAGGLRAGALQVFAHTSPFRPGPRFYRSATIQFEPPSSDTKVLVGAAVSGLRSIYAPGYQLAKAGVMLLDLAGQGAEQQTLDFAAPGMARDQSPLMEVMDRINGRWGKATVHVASTGDSEKAVSDWRMRQERRTPRYTTVLDEVPIARA